MAVESRLMAVYHRVMFLPSSQLVVAVIRLDNRVPTAFSKALVIILVYLVDP